MIANTIKLSVFARENEDSEIIKSKLISLIPFDLDEEKVLVEQQKALGFNEKEIRIFEIVLQKEKHINLFLSNLISKISEEAKSRILQQLETRLDEECNFFLRFSKDRFVHEGELWLTDQGNCFHVKMNIAAFPKKREIALDIVRKVFIIENEQE